MQDESIEPPPVLYLYLPEPNDSSRTEDILARCRLKLSRIGNLNDPFDFIPARPKRNLPAEIRKVLETRLDLNIAKKDLFVNIAKIKSKLDKLGEDPFTGWPEVARSVRLVCMSELNTGILLWAHYAGRHKGFTVAFKTDALSHSPSRLLFSQVRYHNERVPYSTRDLIGENEVRLATFDRLLTQKSPEWQYEKEWRALIPYEMKDQDYLSFDVGAIDSITLGANMSRESEEKLRKACEAGGVLASVKVCRATLSHTHFEIFVEDAQWRDRDL